MLCSIGAHAVMCHAYVSTLQVEFGRRQVRCRGHRQGPHHCRVRSQSPVHTGWSPGELVPPWPGPALPRAATPLSPLPSAPAQEDHHFCISPLHLFFYISSLLLEQCRKDSAFNCGATSRRGGERLLTQYSESHPVGTMQDDVCNTPISRV